MEASSAASGRLTIFFGYAAGVGKTYAMLQAAHAAQDKGIDVVAGYVEPHSRPATAALKNGLEALPTISLCHNGLTIHEFDLNAALRRKPQLLLLDELAHTNASGCRHEKRYQDAQELLRAGIDIYTTLNVQHIESLNDIINGLTGIAVRERIPDAVFDEAVKVELIDLEPQELIERLSTGKIYKDTQAHQAMENFFSVANLASLREIAMRRCADRAAAINTATPTGQPHYIDEHIMVCLSSSPTNPKIIRTAARMARAFDGKFTALFIKTPAFAAMSTENRLRLNSNIKLAEQLGATIEINYGDDTAIQIAEFSRLNHASKVVIGRSNIKRRHLFSAKTLVEKLIAYAPELDVYIIPDSEIPTAADTDRKPTPPHRLADISKSIAILAVATIIGAIFDACGISEANIITIYILGVLLTAATASQRRYGVLSALCSVLIFNFFFTAPRFTLHAYDNGYFITFIIMFIAALLSSTLAAHLKNDAQASAQTAYRTSILLDTSRLLQQASDGAQILDVTARQLYKLLSRVIVVYNIDNDSLTEPKLFGNTDDYANSPYLTADEHKVAAWVLKNRQHAGAATNTFSQARCRYLSVRTGSRAFAVIGIEAGPAPIDAFENNIVLAILGECALAMENNQTSKEKETAAILAKNEQLRADLLRSISHDLRTPLTSISGNAGILLADNGTLPEPRRRRIYNDIYKDAQWLTNLVENLLAITRLNDGRLKLVMAPELLDDIAAAAMQHFYRHDNEHPVCLKPADGIVMARLDAKLMVQVIVNILDNAMKYTPAGSTITISSKKSGNMAIMEIADNGPGIPDNEKDKVFQMFYTANATGADSRRGLGMGLALCRSIIAAHGGTITVHDNKPTGALFRLTLPAEEVTLRE